MDEKRLRETLESIISAGLGESLETLVNLGLLTGIERLRLKTGFLDRLQQHAKQKANLAEYLNRDAVGDGFPSLPASVVSPPKRHPSLFFESGSTIAYVIGEWAKTLRDGLNSPPLEVDILTNNLFALTALVDLVRNVSPVKGNLLARYFGFFPFAEKDPTTPESWQREATGYNRLAEDILQCDQIYATCSNFSPLAGPLVGSRGNALTKHAICTRRRQSARLSMSFHFEKYIPLSDKLFTSFGMSGSKPNCHCVYHGEPKPVRDSLTVQMRSKPKDIAVQGWHLDMWLTKPDHCMRAIASFVSAADSHAITVKLPFRGNPSWLDDCKGISLLIALPEAKAIDARSALETDLKLANDITQRTKGVTFTIAHASDNVVQVDIN